MSTCVAVSDEGMPSEELLARDEELPMAAVATLHPNAELTTIREGGTTCGVADDTELNEEFMLRKLSLELARLTEIETCQQDVGALAEFPLVCFDDTFEIDRWQFLRLPADFSGSLSWRMVKYHCFLGNRSESFYRSISTEQWLRTVITMQKPSEACRGLEILSNVVPRRAFSTRLEGAMVACRGHQCAGGFLPSSALREGDPLNTRLSCTNCALVEQLRIIEADRMGSVVELDKILKFWFLEMKDVTPVKDIEGDVSTILWRNGTFARKRFPKSDAPYQNTKVNRELDVALTVSHPNIVHYFGCSSWWPSSADCDMFMEFLEEDLESFLSRLEDVSPGFSFQDSLQVLLQIAEAVKHLHEKKFIHGDLKPGNILLSKLPMHSDDPFYLVKVADFGCSQRINSSGTATVEAFDFKIGTRFYTAPEVYMCRKIESEIKRRPNDLQKIRDFQIALRKIDPQKIDVYSFGVIADNVVTGVTNLGGTNLDGNRLSLLESFIQRCQAQEPQDRPPFAEICTMLSSVIEFGP